MVSVSPVVESQCRAGLAAYLADTHGRYRNQMTALGLVGGAIGSVALWFASQRVTGLTPIIISIPFISAVAVGFGIGVANADSEDSELEQTYMEVCGEVLKPDEEEEDEDEDDEGDGE